MLRPWKDNHLKIPEIRSRQKQGDDYGHHYDDYDNDYDYDDYDNDLYIIGAVCMYVCMYVSKSHYLCIQRIYFSRWEFFFFSEICLFKK